MLYEILKNGIEVAIQENHQSRAVSVQCWVKAGSLHETAEERGMAHFIEHMLFKGTDSRGVGEIGHTVESCGGDINAYTTFDRTVFYLTLMSSHRELGVELLSDAIFNSSFDPNELAAEKKVVLEEISRGLDDPGSKVGREIFKLCYPDTEAGRPVIGSPESVNSFDRRRVLEFYQKWYHPENLNVVVVGDFCRFEMLEMVKKHFENKPRNQKPTETVMPHSSFPTQPTVSIIHDDSNLPKVEIVMAAPDIDHQDTIALDMASFVLGSGSGCRLNKSLREASKNAVATGASCFTPAFEGILAVSAYANESTYLKAIEQIGEEILALKTTNPITREELERAKVNLQSDHIYEEETVDGQARSLGHSLLSPQKVFYEDSYSATVAAMTPDLVNSAISRWFDHARVLIVGLLPNDSTISEEQILDAYLKGGQLLAKDTDKSSSAQRTPQPKTTEVRTKITPDSPPPQNITVSTILSGVQLVYRQIEGCKLFAMTAVTEGGSRAETPSNSGEQSSFSQLLSLETKSLSYANMVAKIEGLGASLSGFSGKDSLGLNLHCLSKDAKSLGAVFVDCLLSPVFPKEQWELQAAELKEIFATQNDAPSSVCLRRFQEKLFGDHPYSRPSYGTEASTGTFNEETLLENYTKYVGSGPWTFSAVGSYSHDEIHEWLHGELGSFAPELTKREFSSNELLPTPGTSGIDFIEKDREQTHIAFGYLGLSWFDEDRAALDVLINILGGHGGRLFMNLREKQSLAYTVAPVVAYGCHPGIVASYIACAPDKAQQALKSMKNEFRTLQDELPSQEEISRAKNYIVGSHEMGLQKTDSQAMTMALMQTYGIGYDDFTVYPARVMEVTAEQVRKVAQRLFEGRGYTTVVGPNRWD